MPRISIFLSLFDAHVQRVPIAGEVVAVKHRPGQFGSADLDAASRGQRTQQRGDPHARRSRGDRRADRRPGGPPHRVRRQGRRQAGARRDLRPDPVRVAAGHLPARRLQRARRRPASGRSAAKRYWPSCRDQAPRQAAGRQPAHPAQRDDGGGDLPRIDVGQARARRPADRGDGASGGRRDPRRARRPHRPGAQGDLVGWARRSTRWPTRSTSVSHRHSSSTGRCCRTRGWAGSWCCCTRCASCCGWPGSTRCSTWTNPPTRRSTSSACPPRRRDRRDRTAGGQDAVRRRLVDVGMGRGVWMIGVSLLAVSTHPDAEDPHLLGVAEHGRTAAGGAGDRCRRVDPLRLHRHPGDHLGVRHSHPVRDAHQALPGRASGGVGGQTTTAARGAQGDPPGVGAATSRSMSRLGLRKPGA